MLLLSSNLANLNHTLYTASQLHRVLFPKDRDPVPLDVAAGVNTPENCSCMEGGPILNLHMQQHPGEGMEGRFVSVLTFRNHLSQGYFDSSEKNINDLQFQLPPGQSQKYLRVFTGHCNGGLPRMEFGSSDASQRLFEADPHAQDMEVHSMHMTNFLFSLQDKAFRDATDILQRLLLQSKEHSSIDETNIRSYWTTSGKCSEDEKRKLDEEERKMETPSEPGTKFHYPVAVSKCRLDSCIRGGVGPHDSTDGGHCNVSCSVSYSPHSDTKHKHGNHSDKFICHHADTMRIFTQCYAFAKRKGRIPFELISIRHGLPRKDTVPGGPSHDFGSLFGYFSSVGFRSVDKPTFVLHRPEDEITLGGDAHGHLQLPGSQGDLHHVLKFLPRRDDIMRVIFSTRKFQPFREELKEYCNNAGRNVPHCHPYSDHKRRNILETLRGWNRILPPPPSHTEPSGNVDSSSQGTGEGTEATNCEPRHASVGWKPGAMKSGVIDSVEDVQRDAVVGTKGSYDLLKVAANHNVSRDMIKLGTTLCLVPQGGSGHILAGPVVTKIGGITVAFRPGDEMPSQDVDSTSNIKQNKRSKGILSRSNDTLDIRSGSKNSCEFMENVEIVSTLRKTPLKSMFIGGSGGSIISPEMFDRVSSENGHKDDPSCLLPTGQKVDSGDEISLMRCAQYGQSLNVFFDGMYLGLFYIKEVRYRRAGLVEAKSQLSRFGRCLERLNKLNPEKFPHSKPTQSMRNELSSMLGMRFWYEFAPVDPKFHYRWSSKEQFVPWKYEKVTYEDFVLPKVAFKKEHLDELVGITGDGTFTDIESLLSLPGYHYLSESGVSKLLDPNVDLEHDWVDQRNRTTAVDKTKEREHHPLASVTKSSQLSIDAKELAVSAMVHGSAAALVKAVGGCVSKVNKDCNAMIPAGAVIADDAVGLSVDVLMDTKNLKGTLSRPIHPSNCSYCPANQIAQSATGCFTEGQLRKRDCQYLLTEDGWLIVFKCCLSQLTSSHCLLQIMEALGHLNCVRGGHHLRLPESKEQLDGFLRIVQGRRWTDAVVNKHFRSSIQGKDHFIVTMLNLWKSGRQAFESSIVQVNDVTPNPSRPEILIKLIDKFRDFVGISLDQYQMHLLMQSVEMCIHEPFGEVLSVPCCAESEDESKFLLKHWGDNGREALELPAMIVEFMNERARVKKRSRDSMIEKELLVMGLAFNDDLNCLVHRRGIGKKFDASDAERLLRMMHMLHQHTLPAANVSRRSRLGNEMFYPLRLDGVMVSALPFMQNLMEDYKITLPAYKELLKEPKYEHSNLHELYRIDLRLSAEASRSPPTPVAPRQNTKKHGRTHIDELEDNCGEKRLRKDSDAISPSTPSRNQNESAPNSRSGIEVEAHQK
jgi:hypothetical protein